MRKGPAVLALLAAGAACAACGGSSGNGIASKPPSQVLQTAIASLRSATSVTVVGDVTSGGTTTTINGTFYGNGDFDGTVGKGGTSAKLVKIGSTDYINAPLSYWTANGTPASVAGRIASRWISIPDSQAHAGTDLSIGNLADTLSKPTGTLSAGTTGTIDGQAAYSITSSKGGTLWVTSTGTVFPIELVGANGGNSGTLTFSAWNTSPDPTPPTGAVAASSITGGTGTTGSGTTGSGTTGTSTTGVTGATGTSSTTGTSGTTGTGSTTGTTGGDTTTTVP